MINAGILIGCSTYDDKAIANLRYAANDAKVLKELLALVCGVTAENSYLLATGIEGAAARPSRSEIIRVLAKGSGIARATAIDNLFLVFSGHGFRSQSGVDYLAPEDTVADALEETALPFDFLIERLRQWKARRTILFIDACRAGSDGAKIKPERSRIRR